MTQSGWSPRASSRLVRPSREARAAAPERSGGGEPGAGAPGVGEKGAARPRVGPRFTSGETLSSTLRVGDFVSLHRPSSRVSPEPGATGLASCPRIPSAQSRAARRTLPKLRGAEALTGPARSQLSARLHSRAPTVSVSPRSMAELMAGASLLALRSISSMTPCTSGPDKLWNSIAAGPAGPGARLLRGRACPPPQLPGAPGANGPYALPPRPRPRPSSAAPPGRAPGPGRPRARTPPAEAWGQLHRGAPGRRRQSQGHKGTGRGGVAGDEGRGRRPPRALSRRGHRPPVFCAQGAKQGRKLCPGGDGCSRGSPRKG